MSAKLVVLLMAVVLLSQLASAQDFSATAHAKIDACACSIIKDEVVVANKEIANSFVLEQRGEAAGWATLTEKKFTIAPMQEKIIGEYVKVPCSAEGSYDLVTEFATDTKVKKVMKQQLFVKKCSNIKVIPKHNSLSGCRCSTFNYFFDVENTGSFSDVYSFNVDKLGRHSTVSEPASLNAGEKTKALLSIRPPCEKAGSYSFNLVTKTQRNNFELKTPLKLNINASCAATNFTLTKPFWQQYSTIAFVSFPAILIIILLTILVLAFLRAPKKPKEQPKIEKRYQWKKMFKEPKAPKKEQKFVLGVVLGLAALLLVVNSVFIAKTITPRATVITNITNETVTNATNLTNETGWRFPAKFLSYEGKLFGGFFNVKIASWLNGEKKFYDGLFETKPTPWLKNWSKALFVWKEKPALPEQKNKSEKLERNESTEGKLEKNELKNKGVRISVLSKAEDISKKSAAEVKDFMLTYLYYIIAGVTVLALIITFLAVREKRKNRKEAISEPKKVYKPKKRKRQR
jgi:predicted small secreted protein